LARAKTALFIVWVHSDSECCPTGLMDHFCRAKHGYFFPSAEAFFQGASLLPFNQSLIAVRIPIPDPDDFRYKKKNPNLSEREKYKLVCDALVSATEKQKLGTLDIVVPSQKGFEVFYRREVLTILETIARQNPIAFSVPKDNYGKEEIPENEREDTLVDERTMSRPRPPAYREAPLPEETPIKLTLFENFDNWRESYIHARSITVWDLDPDQIDVIRKLCLDIDRKFRIKPEPKIVLIQEKSLRATGRGDALDFLKETEVIAHYEISMRGDRGIELIIHLNVEKFLDFKKDLIKKISPPPEKTSDFQNSLKWEDVIIKFEGKTTVTIKIGKNRAFSADYKDMGFVDGRTKGTIEERPNSQWDFLKNLAENQGEISWGDDRAHKTIKKTKQLLSQALRKYFNIASDPFYPYRRQTERLYKIRLQLKPLPE
jgi:hypothetical protein